MTMQRWRPGRRLLPSLGDIYELQHRMEDFWPGFGRITFGTEGLMPVVDFYEKDGNYVIKAELPGMKEEDVDVSVTGDRLTIKGEKKAETEVKEDDYYRSERSYGMFTRSIDLPPDIDTEKIEANYENGVLEVSIPKTPEFKSKKISVSHKEKEQAKA